MIKLKIIKKRIFALFLLRKQKSTDVVPLSFSLKEQKQLKIPIKFGSKEFSYFYFLKND